MGRHSMKQPPRSKTKTSHPSSMMGAGRKHHHVAIVLQGVLWSIAGGVGCLFCTRVSLFFSILFTAMPRRLEPWEGTLLVFAALALVSLLPAPFPRAAKPYLLIPAVLMTPGAFMFLFLALDAYAAMPQTAFVIAMFVILVLMFLLTTVYRLADTPRSASDEDPAGESGTATPAEYAE